MQHHLNSETAFPYRTVEYEQVPCNLCGRDIVEVINRQDRNGLRVESCICKFCGLIYINPRMTSNWYGEYYKSEYRLQMARFREMPASLPDYDEMFRKSTMHGIELAKCFKSIWRNGLTIEVGSSVGGVLNGIRQEIGVNVLGIEPSPDESNHANKHGIKTYTALIENFQGDLPPAENIVCTQSLNHFLDPRYFLTWAHRHLNLNGLLILEVMNFRQVFRRFGWMRRAIQIDHTYMFVTQSLANFVEAAGFEILQLESGERGQAASKPGVLPGMHIRIVAKKTEREPFADQGRIREEYLSVMRSLNEVPVKPFRYFFKHRFKKWVKKTLRNPRTSR
ncbi:MAG: hypothetical protein JWM99_906 [Verrucomicrobiales bacterium]|nr:hypothetical protein [Verrucomicrobiales bacterium]